MSRTERREYIVGLLAASLLTAVLVLTAMANRQTITVGDNLYRLTADFGQADGIYVGSQVRIGGVNVGEVSRMVLDRQNQAALTLQFHDHIPLPEDTAAVIETDGLFGSKHVELYPGGGETPLESGAHISYTQNSVILENLITLIVDRARAAAKSGPPQN